MKMVWRLAVTLILGFAATGVGHAADVGPRNQVRAVRSDARTLLAERAQSWHEDARAIVVDSVAIGGDRATVEWHVGEHRDTAHFVNIDQRWWNLTNPVNDGYLVRFTPAHPNLGPNDDQMPFAIVARRPNRIENWLAPHGNAYAYFTMKLAPAVSKASFASGSAVDVWFPFVLDPALDYSLTIGFADPAIGPIHGTLRNNTLHFVLPPFIAPPDTTMMAEIDGDPH